MSLGNWNRGWSLRWCSKTKARRLNFSRNTSRSRSIIRPSSGACADFGLSRISDISRLVTLLISSPHANYVSTPIYRGRGHPRSCCSLRKRNRSGLLPYFAFDPGVGDRQTSGQWLFRPPAKLPFYQSIVGIAAPNPERSRYVPFLQLLAGDGHNAVSKLIDRHHLVGTDVHWPLEAGTH